MISTKGTLEEHPIHARFAKGCVLLKRYSRRHMAAITRSRKAKEAVQPTLHVSNQEITPSIFAACGLSLRMAAVRRLILEAIGQEGGPGGYQGELELVDNSLENKDGQPMVRSRDTRH